MENFLIIRNGCLPNLSGAHQKGYILLSKEHKMKIFYLISIVFLLNILLFTLCASLDRHEEGKREKAYRIKMTSYVESYDSVVIKDR
jgi:hypothetical protein